MATPYEIIYQYIQDDVDRPDKIDVINRRIQRALLYYHRLERFFKDMIEQIYVFENSNAIDPQLNLYPPVGSQSLFLTSATPVGQIYVQRLDKRLLTRFRAVQYINKGGATELGGSGDITERNPDSMFDTYGGQVSDVFYESGDFLQIKAVLPLPLVYIGYLSDPMIEPVVLINSWIARDYAALIAAAVKVRMFSDMGKQDELRTAASEVTSEERSLLANNIKLSSRK